MTKPMENYDRTNQHKILRLF